MLHLNETNKDKINVAIENADCFQDKITPTPFVSMNILCCSAQSNTCSPSVFQRLPDEYEAALQIVASRANSFTHFGEKQKKKKKRFT